MHYSKRFDRVEWSLLRCVQQNNAESFQENFQAEFLKDCRDIGTT